MIKKIFNIRKTLNTILTDNNILLVTGINRSR